MFLLLFATHAWADTLSNSEIPEEMICMVMVRYHMPCHVQTSWSNIATCDIFYTGELYKCNVVFNTYAPPKGSVLVDWKFEQVPDLMGVFESIQLEDFGVRGSPYRYPVDQITTILYKEENK